MMDYTVDSIRKELAAMDAANQVMETTGFTGDADAFKEARLNLQINLVGKLHLLLDENQRLAKELARARAMLADVHRNAPQQEPEVANVARNHAIAGAFWIAGKMIHKFLSGEGEVQS